MSRHAGPEVIDSPVASDLVPDMETRVALGGGYTLSKHPEYRGDLAIIKNRNMGIAGYVHVDEPYQQQFASDMASCAEQEIASDYIPQDRHPEQRIAEHFQRVNQLAGAHGIPAMLSLTRIWEENNGYRYAVIAHIGSGQVYLNRAQEGQGYAQAEPLFRPDPTAVLDGSDEALEKLQTKIILLGPGDRLTTASPAAQYNEIEGELTPGSVDQVAPMTDLEYAARLLTGLTEGERDRMVTIQQNMAGVVTPIGRHEASPRSVAASIPPLESAYAKRPGGQPYEPRQPYMADPTVATLPPTQRSSWWRRHWPGATAAGAAALVGYTAYKDFKNERARRQQEKIDAGNFSKWDKAKAAFWVAPATLGAWFGPENYHLKKWDKRRYRRFVDPYERHVAIERHRQRKGLLIGALAVGTAIAAPFLKQAGMDIVPSHLKINFGSLGHFTIGDGDGIDLTPWHGTSHYHATSIWDKRDGGFPRAFFGYLFDDDPAFPKPKPHHALILPPETPAPRGEPYLGYPPPVLGGAHPPAPPTWHPIIQEVTTNNAYTDSIEGNWHQLGHHLFGFEHYTGADAHNAFIEFRQWAHEHGYGDNFLLINGKPGTYEMANGDVGLIGPGRMQFVNREVEEKALEFIRANAS